MKRILVLASALCLAACAAAGTPPTSSGRSAGGGLSVSDVTTGFLVGVINGCAAAAEAGKTLEQLNSPMIVRDDGRDAMLKPRDCYTPWAPGIGKGIVTIDDGAASCEVSAYGVPVEATFAAIVLKLGEQGYTAKPGVVPGAKHYATDLSKTVGGRTINVSLGGSEPGAVGRMSRFSTVLGVVRVSTP
jgi:hypothetical protein